MPWRVSVGRRQQGSSARTGIASSGEPYRIVAVPFQSTTEKFALVLGRPLEATNNIMGTLAWSLVLFGVLGAAVSSAIGFVIARSAIRPVQRLTEAVTRVTDTNDLTPITVDGSGELADLGRSFNTMLGTLASSRERQKRLIADAGHELRTTLTALRTNVELLVADERSNMLPEGARSDILRDIAGQLGEFTTLVGDLVHLSREDVVEQLAAAHPGVQQAQWQFQGVGPGQRIRLAGKQFGAGDQHLPFFIERRDRQTGGVDAVGVDDSGVEFESADALDDARRTQAALQLHSYQWMFEAEGIGQQGHRARRGRDDTEP